jgi:hypothetical protein
VISALGVLQQEDRLKKLDTNADAVYVLVSPEVPYIVLWASTKFPQVTTLYHHRSRLNDKFVYVCNLACSS